MKERVIINVPVGDKPQVPSVSFYGRATLGGKRNSYTMSLEDYHAIKDKLKKKGWTVARDQPWLSDKKLLK